MLENRQVEQLQQRVKFSVWERLDNEHTVVRFVTGWTTGEEDIAALEALL